MDYRPMVNHLTRVVLKPLEDPFSYAPLKTGTPATVEQVRQFGEGLKDRAERVAAMMEALADRGFTLHFAKDRIFADSTEIEAQEAKRYLLEQGFRDREFQIFLEYARKWDVL